jgi:uncharacterized protein Veg
VNILNDILQTNNGETLNTEVFTSFRKFFQNNVGNTFVLKKQNDPSLKLITLIRIKKVYPRHVLVETLNEQRQPVYPTSILYASLLDCDNSQQQHTCEIQKIITKLSIIKD